jgi:two-component system, LuxR family, response regulator FixJ
VTELPCKANCTVHIVDDDRGTRDSLQSALAFWGISAATYESAIHFLESYQPSVTGILIVDFTMPHMSGLELMSRLKDLGSTLRMVLITGEPSDIIREHAMRLGAIELLEKPVRLGYLVGLIFGESLSPKAISSMLPTSSC